MGMIKDRNIKDLKEAEDIKKRWQKYKELYKNVLMTKITTMRWSATMPDILECEVKWASKALLQTKLVHEMN